MIQTRSATTSIRRFAGLAILLLVAPGVGAGEDETSRLSALLVQFLAGASRNDIDAHERFWSDELVYTSSSGTRFGKSDILAGIRDSAPQQPDETPTVYTAEDVDIRVYGDTAVVAFRLVGTSEGSVQEYFNTGTFIRRDGEWRAVAWQATRIPAAEASD